MWGTKVQAQYCHLILLRAKLRPSAAQNIDEIAAALNLAKKEIYRQIILTWNHQTLDFYGYFCLNTPALTPLVDPEKFLGGNADLFAEVQISRLQIEDFISGQSIGSIPLNRYVVEMDPEAGWQEELFAWYDQEHLPGLASVPGCITATRCINVDHSPFSIAFYDLINPEVLGCEAWLNVRNTAWSDRARPHFTNVKRTMLTIV